MKPDKTILKEVFGVGVPSAIQNMLNVTGMTIINNIQILYYICLIFFEINCALYIQTRSSRINIVKEITFIIKIQMCFQSNQGVLFHNNQLRAATE